MQDAHNHRNNIRRERELRGWSQGDVAEKLGCDARSVGRWERGVVSPSAYYRQRLCQIFEQNVEELGFLQVSSEDIPESTSLQQEDVREPSQQNSEECKDTNNDQGSIISVAEPESSQWEMPIDVDEKLFQQKRSEIRQGVPGFRMVPTSMLIGSFLLLMLILGSINVFLFHAINIKNPVSIVPISTAPISSVLARTVPKRTPVISTIPYGRLLYRTAAPGSKCDLGGGRWVDYNQPDIQCLATMAVISNPSVTAPDLRGTILANIPGATYPDNYVVEALVQQPVTAADFGLYFRNQPGDQQGIYTFSLHPDGTWGVYVYDNKTAAQTLLKAGKTSIDPHAQLYLTVVAIGPDFTLYINRQKVGQVHDKTYRTGTGGIAVDAGGTLIVNGISLYSVAQ